MISEVAPAPTPDHVFVWVFLPGDTTPTLCGRFNHRQTAAGQPVGGFVYGKRYLGLPHAQPIDPVVLQLRDTSYETAANAGVWGVIADACPDDWGRYVIDRKHGAQRYPLGYLVRSQEDRVGNLCFSLSPEEPPHLEAPTSIHWLDEAWFVISGLEDGRPIPPELDAKIRPNTAMGGARPKLTVVEDGVQWLAKFPSHRDVPTQSVPRIEAAMLDLAKCCHIAVPEVKLRRIPGQSERDVALMVRRFDRLWAPAQAGQREASGWLRDAYVSARTVFQSDPGQYDQQYTGSYTRLARELVRWGDNAHADRYELFRRLVFNCSVSNTDDHDRNHGFLADEMGGGFRLAPAFDIVPRVHGTTRRYQAMSFGDQGSLATIENILSAIEDFDLPHATAVQIIEEIQTTVQEGWKRCLLDREVEAEGIAALAKCFQPLPVSL